MARGLYTLLWGALAPWLPLRLVWRARREPGYRERIGERYGRYRDDVARPSGETWWVHAVSVGETRAAAPLIERILGERPQATLLLTCTTATGRATGRELYGRHGARVIQAWLPYDLPFAVHAFLERFAPRAGLLMETELWPNLAAACARRGVPLFLVNARMSPRSARGYARVDSLTRPMLASLAGVAAQTEEDARRLAALGAREPVATGNLKFDVEPPPSQRELGSRLRAAFGVERRVWIAASTRDGEEALLLDALARHPLDARVLTVIVPRHPQRFDEVAGLLDARGLRYVRRSAGSPVTPNCAFVLGDSMGEMFAYYAAAEAAFVGGSLVPLGGQNLLEPIALGVPTIVGPSTYNFEEATAQAVECAAALRVGSADELVGTVDALLADPVERARLREAALAFHAAHRGATARLWTWLAQRLGIAPAA